MRVTLATLAGAQADLADGPWIGILGLPSAIECDSMLGAAKGPGASCFSGLYDDWVRASGARAVGIPHNAFDANTTELNELLASLDGVLFTGGGLELAPDGSAAPYYRTGDHIFHYSIQQKKAGVQFPVHGHCMGFQFLAILAAQGNTSVLESQAFDSESLSLPLEWTKEASETKWYKSLPADVLETFTNENSTTNLHHDGVTPDTFYTNPLLPNFFTVISTNHDRAGKAFLSTMEAKDYPIFGAQWHAERNLFEWKASQDVDHSPAAVRANAWAGLSFVADASTRPVRPRNEALLRKHTTYSMTRSQEGDVLEGYQYIHFGADVLV
mmetsp:Transcript_31758/g.69470  ORF Transcript_31758/g.69470 Transcript_31758/m.69470 type:complete len:327 (+) Transcript_31758:45-1025(+)